VANVSLHDTEPPLKRQALDKTTTTSRSTTPNRQQQPITNGVEARIFERGSGTSGSTAFQKKLVAARDKSSGLRVTKAVEPSAKEESVRQWQKHYRKIFPSFNFYFDGLSEDIKSRFLRQIILLGGVCLADVPHLILRPLIQWQKEEKFFSKTVTHIITVKPIPPEHEATKDVDAVLSPDDHTHTINPLLLDKSAPATLRSRNIPAAQLRKDGASGVQMDILQRGRQMGMKIWQTEKLNRVLTTVLDDLSRSQHSRAALTVSRSIQEDLSQVLRNDKLGPVADRDPLSSFRDMIVFKGPFIYIHDMDEKYKPTMVREYASVARRQDGEWPQFRSAGVGKCPFVEDPHMKRELEQDRRNRAQQRSVQREPGQAAKPQSTATLEAPKMDPPRRASPRKALQNVRNPPPPLTIKPSLLNQGPARTESQLSFPPMPEHQKFDFVQPPLMNIAREPAASGIQRSNLTSAIQSQMISSTAGTGIKAGTSREVHELKRKVLERTHTGSMSVGSIPSSHRMTDLAGVLKNARGPAPQRAAKSKAQEKLGGIHEEDPYADDMAAEKAARVAMRRKKQPAQKDPKPGYCENCRDKYDDFEEVSRQVKLW
jgi:regulatory subunit for Cdc7p protein kinase